MEARKVRARRAGTAGGNGRAKGGEIEALKKQAAQLYNDVRGGKIKPGIGSVLVQALNVQARLWEAERRAALAEADIMTAGQLAKTRSRIVSIITAHVKDREAIKAIAADLRREDDAPKESAL